jgi:hypothetical protein
MKHSTDSIRSRTDAFRTPFQGWTKEIKREVPHGLGPERHSLLDRLPLQARLRSQACGGIRRHQPGSRANIRRTCAACHSPRPAAVEMPRWFNSVAMPRSVINARHTGVPASTTRLLRQTGAACRELGRWRSAYPIGC